MLNFDGREAPVAVVPTMVSSGVGMANEGPNADGGIDDHPTKPRSVERPEPWLPLDGYPGTFQ